MGVATFISCCPLGLKIPVLPCVHCPCREMLDKAYACHYVQSPALCVGWGWNIRSMVSLLLYVDSLSHSWGRWLLFFLLQGTQCWELVSSELQSVDQYLEAGGGGCFLPRPTPSFCFSSCFKHCHSVWPLPTPWLQPLPLCCFPKSFTSRDWPAPQGSFCCLVGITCFTQNWPGRMPGLVGSVPIPLAEGE